MAPKGKDKSASTSGAKGSKANAKGKESKDSKTAEEKGGKVKGAQQINVRHILCEKHARKEEALTKLREGAKFDDVAREFSEDKARAGGALGWKRRGDLDPAFEAVAFELESSTVGNPKWGEVKTGFGYHLMMVEGRK